MKAPTLPDVQGQQAAFLQYRSTAEAVPEDKVKVRGDVILGRENYLRGLEHVLAHKQELAGKWPPARIERLERDAEIAHGAVFAASRAEMLDTGDATLKPLIAETYDLRGKALKALEAAAAFGLVPAEQVAKLRQGSGSIDAGQDLVNAAALYRDHVEALTNKTPITPEFLARMEQVGNRVTLALTPGDAKARVEEEAKAAAELANRFWTLLVELHAELRRAGYELWGDGQDAFVPALQSRAAPPRPAAATAPTPA